MLHAFVDCGQGFSFLLQISKAASLSDQYKSPFAFSTFRFISVVRHNESISTPSKCSGKSFEQNGSSELHPELLKKADYFYSIIPPKASHSSLIHKN
jgi:hypothetical protein